MCDGLHCAPPNSYVAILTSRIKVPQNVNVFRDKASADVTS